MLRSVHRLFPVVLVGAVACGATSEEDAVPDPSSACGQTFGETAPKEALAALAACKRDPAGVGCEASAFLTRGAAICAATQRHPEIRWRASLFHDRVAHRVLWKMNGSLAQARNEGGDHPHLLLDARTGDTVEIQLVDPRDSAIFVLERDGTETRAGEFSGAFLLSSGRVVSFDAKAGRRYAEAYKLGARKLTRNPSGTYDVAASVVTGQDTLQVEFTAEITISNGVVRLNAEVPVGDKRLRLELQSTGSAPPEL